MDWGRGCEIFLESLFVKFQVFIINRENNNHSVLWKNCLIYLLENSRIFKKSYFSEFMWVVVFENTSANKNMFLVISLGHIFEVCDGVCFKTFFKASGFYSKKHREQLCAGLLQSSEHNCFVIIQFRRICLKFTEF